MEILASSSPQGDGSFLHVGYTSVNNGPMRSRDTDHGGFAYLLDDISLQVSRKPSLAGEPSHGYDGYFSLGLEPSWQAPEAYSRTFGISIPVKDALAIPELPAESELAASLGEPLSPLIRKESFVIPPGSETGSIAQAGPGLAILVSFIAGVMLLLLYRRILEKHNRRILVHLFGGLFLAVVLPLGLAFENSARAQELEREWAIRESNKLQASAPSRTTGLWSDRDVNWREPWTAITPVRYEHPELATVVLMHGIIGHALYYFNDDVNSLAQLQLAVGIPGVQEYTPGMKYALKYYGLDGWGREFRFSSRKLVPDEQYLRTEGGWLAKLESAGADGEFGTADDLILTTHQRAKQMYEGGFFKQAYNHYAAYVAPDDGSGLVAYLPGYLRSRATRYKYPPCFSQKHVAPPSAVNELKGRVADYNAALSMIRDDYLRGGADGLALHLYGISRENFGEELYEQYR